MTFLRTKYSSFILAFADLVAQSLQHRGEKDGPVVEYLDPEPLIPSEREGVVELLDYVGDIAD